jgi:hypothetical protein
MPSYKYIVIIVAVAVFSISFILHSLYHIAITNLPTTDQNLNKLVSKQSVLLLLLILESRLIKGEENGGTEEGTVKRTSANFGIEETKGYRGTKEWEQDGPVNKCIDREAHDFAGADFIAKAEHRDSSSAPAQ